MYVEEREKRSFGLKKMVLLRKMVKLEWNVQIPIFSSLSLHYLAGNVMSGPATFLNFSFFFLCFYKFHSKEHELFLFLSPLRVVFVFFKNTSTNKFRF